MGGFGQLGNQEEPQYLNRKGLRSREHNSIAMKSRMMGGHQVRFRERLVAKFHRPTRHINAPEDGGSPCSSVEASVMDVERRGGQSKMGDFGQLGNQEEPHDLNRKRLFSQGNNLIAMKSRVRRESQARFCERLVVKFHRPTRQPRRNVGNAWSQSN